MQWWGRRHALAEPEPDRTDRHPCGWDRVRPLAAGMGIRADCRAVRLPAERHPPGDLATGRRRPASGATGPGACGADQCRRRLASGAEHRVDCRGAQLRPARRGECRGPCRWPRRNLRHHGLAQPAPPRDRPGGDRLLGRPHLPVRRPGPGDPVPDLRHLQSAGERWVWRGLHRADFLGRAGPRRAPGGLYLPADPGRARAGERHGSRARRAGPRVALATGRAALHHPADRADAVGDLGQLGATDDRLPAPRRVFLRLPGTGLHALALTRDRARHSNAGPQRGPCHRIGRRHGRSAHPARVGRILAAGLARPPHPRSSPRASVKLAAAVAGVVILVGLGALLAYGLLQPLMWSTTIWVFGVGHGTHAVFLPPFHAFSTIDVFDADNNVHGTHFYLLGSDDGGRDLVALTARGALPSLTLVGLVVIARVLIGALAGLAMGLGYGPVRRLSRGMSRWVIGFPYLALAIIVIHALSPRNRLLAFVIGMAVVGWRDVAEVVAERIEYVRSQPFAMSARALGTHGVTFFRIHVLPHLRPALAVELPFQASAVLVLLAELGYLKVFIGGVISLSEGERGSETVQLLTQPEIGQLLSDSYRYIIHNQFLPVLVPALAIVLAALAFELIGTGLRSQIDRSVR